MKQVGRQAGTHTETRKRVDSYKSAIVACVRSLHVHGRLFVTQTETPKFDIYKIVGCDVSDVSSRAFVIDLLGGA